VADLLASPETLASYLQRNLDRSTATLALAGASELVRGYCRWNISNETTTVRVNGNGSGLLTLPTLKLISVSVDVDGSTVDEAAYQWSEGGQLRRVDGDIWPAGFGNINALIEHGYTTVPDDVTLVTCAVAARYYSNPESLRSKQVGNVSRVYGTVVIASDFTEIEVALLARYRL
jgi:hypothetical protein